MTFEEWFEVNALAEMNRGICKSAYQAGQAEARELVGSLQQKVSRYESDHPWAKELQDVAENAMEENLRLLELVERMREALVASENIMRIHNWPKNREKTLDLIAETDKFLGRGE